jgi:hypothetical protein
MMTYRRVVIITQKMPGAIVSPSRLDIHTADLVLVKSRTMMKSGLSRLAYKAFKDRFQNPGRIVGREELDFIRGTAVEIKEVSVRYTV